MPKKTKRDKIIAQKRRSSVAVSTPSLAVADTSTSPSLYTFVSPAEKKLQKAVSAYAIELQTIKRDLYKTIFLAILAFSAELYIYWLLQR